MHSASLLLTHSLSLFTIPLISSSGSHTDCHCSQAGSSTMTSAHKNGAERTFRISKGEREAEGVRMHLRNQRETDRETGESFTVHHHSKSWVYSSESIWALQRPSARLKPETCCTVLQQARTMTNVYLPLSFFRLSVAYSYSHAKHQDWSARRGGSTQVVHLLLAKTCNI